MTGPTLWRDPHSLVLASGSRTRLSMLAAAGLPVVADPARIDERAVQASLSDQGAQAVAQALALAKAREVATRHPGALVLGADQTLDLAGAILHKPADTDQARTQIMALAGRSHALHSGFAVLRDETILASGHATATLTMRPLSAAACDAYLAAAGPAILDSVGGYQLERLGAHLFTTIAGDHFTILGLPLLPVLAALREAGALP